MAELWGHVLASLWSTVRLRTVCLIKSLGLTIPVTFLSLLILKHVQPQCGLTEFFFTCINSLLVNQAQIFTWVVVKLNKLFCNNRSLNLSYFWLLRSPKIAFSRYVSNELIENQIHARRNALIDYILMAQSLINPEILTGKWMKLFLEINIALLQISSMLLEELQNAKN